MGLFWVFDLKWRQRCWVGMSLSCGRIELVMSWLEFKLALCATYNDQEGELGHCLQLMLVVAPCVFSGLNAT